MAPQPVIKVHDLVVGFGDQIVLDRLSLDVRGGEILGVVGGSGAGKSVLLRTIIGLVPKVAGRIEVFGVDLDAADAAQRRGVERRWGILFQQGALFSSLTVRQNIQFPVREYLRVSQRLLDEIMVAKLGMVGLRPEVADRYPSELSGGMIKRVALARALALDPELVFLDEPTSGLDPIGAGDFDELVRDAALVKLQMVGLKPEHASRMPADLSGGMIKRVALARALALDPELVFLDEPTSGLDPIGAGDFDELVRTLQRTLGLTVFMVTHDLDSLYTACDRIAVLGNGKIIAAGSMADMQASQHPWLRAYFHGKRARAVMG